MKCEKCGAKLPNNAIVCKKCGAVVEFPEAELINNESEIEAETITDIIVVDPDKPREFQINKALIASIVFVVISTSIFVYFYVEKNLMHRPSDINKPNSITVTTSGDDSYSGLSDAQVQALTAKDWKSPNFSQKNKERAVDKMMYLIYDSGVTTIYKQYKNDEIMMLIDSFVDNNSIGSLTIYERLLREVTSGSTEELGYEMTNEFLRSLERYDWNNPKFTSDVKLSIAKRTIKMAYYDDHKEIYKYYSASDIVALYDKYAKENVKDDTNAKLYDRLLNDAAGRVENTTPQGVN